MIEDIFLLSKQSKIDDEIFFSRFILFNLHAFMNKRHKLFPLLFIFRIKDVEIYVISKKF